MPTQTKSEKKAPAITTHIAFVIDESGSMSGNEASVVTGYNEFIATMRREGADEKQTRCSVAFFDSSGDDDKVRIKRDAVKLAELPELGPADYLPRGLTPLNDAISHMIGHVGNAMAEADKAMLVIITDGQENASETSTEDLRKLVMSKEQAGWEFLYLGANVDAFAEAKKIGLSGRAGQYARFSSSPQGTKNTMRRAGGQSTSYATMDSASYLAATSSSPDVVAEDPAEFEEQQRQMREAREKAEREANEGVRAQATDAVRKLFKED